MATGTLEVSVEAIGHAFVTQFYQILHTTPEHAYQFFKDSSTMSRPDPTGYLMTVTTIQGIRDLILSSDWANCKAEILTADVQASYMNGITILVTGCLTGLDNVRKKFTESFFLAPQDNGFFVYNDVFNFITEDQGHIQEDVFNFITEDQGHIQEDVFNFITEDQGHIQESILRRASNFWLGIKRKLF
ncbi:nuclear transport factor 2-like [Silene latifolia]|uniref:nuclear transport factor 2-like n=1 Tax=Silene latifolia TaxID=37657 RepID=UPI003D777BC2